MPVHDYILSNQSGSSFRSDLNNALAAIVSQNSSSTEPATKYAYQYWIDTSATPALIKQRNAANDDWVVLAEVGGQILAADGTDAKPGISFAADINTGLKRNAADDVSIVTSGTQALTVKSDQKVGINTTAPGGALEVQTASGERIIFDSAGASQNPRIQLVRDSGADYSLTNAIGQLALQRDGSDIYRHLNTNNTHRFTGTAQFNRPSDWWSSTAFYGLPGYGHLGSEGSFRVHLTSNGYRSTSGWVSHGANNKNGAAQIGLDPIGKIFFGTQQTKNTGETATVTVRAMMDTDGDFLFHQTSSSTPGNNNTTTGAAFENNADGTAFFISRSGNISGSFNRNNDGDIVRFRRAGVEQGDIRVSGSTVTYAGGHLSRFAQLESNADRIEILRGSVLSNLDEMCVWDYDARDAELWEEGDEIPEGASVGDVKIPAREAGTELNEQLNRLKVSDVEGDPNVAGVFEDWDDDDEVYTKDFFCAMTGDFVIRIAQGTTVARGDLLMSAGDGTAKPQDDDIVRSKTLAKVTSTVVSETYADGSYCVPCVLMVC